MVKVINEDEDYFWYALILLTLFALFQAGYGMGNSAHFEYIKANFTLTPITSHGH